MMVESLYQRTKTARQKTAGRVHQAEALLRDLRKYFIILLQDGKQKP